MNLRSRGQQNLQPIILELDQFERRNRSRNTREPDMQNPVEEVQQAPQGGDQRLNQGVGIGALPIPQVDARAARRRIGAFDEPGERTINLGIPTPAVANDNYELKTSLINMVQGSKFYGLPCENPLHHLDQFERLCRTVRINGIPQDAIKMMLFPFSLGDRAAQWEQNIASELVSTWTLCKKEFTNKFFPKQKTAKIRNDITTFRQGPTESFYEAWDRLKGYTRACPHHGVEKDALLGIFHGGVHEKYRIALDTASYGSFANLDVDQGEQLIENLAQSSQCYGGNYDRSLPARVDDQKLKEISEKLDRLDKVLQLSQRPINYMDHCDGYRPDHQEAAMENNEENPEEISFMGNQRNYQYEPYNNNLSYRSQNVENPQDQVYPPFPKQQVTNYQNQGHGNFQPRPYVQQIQGNFQGNNLENQGGYQVQDKCYTNFNNRAPTNNYNPRPQQFNNYQQAGGNSEQPTPDNEVKLTLKQLLEGQGSIRKEIAEIKSNYGNLNSKFEGLATHVKELENQITQVASAVRNNGKGVLPGTPETNPKEFCKAITVRIEEELPGMIIAVKSIETEDNTEKTANEKILVEKAAGIELPIKDGISENTKEKLEEVSEEKAEIELPPYEPKLPFPGRFKKQTLDKQFEKFRKLLETVEVTMPLKDLILDCPMYNKLLKGILTKKKKIEEAMMQVNHECSAIIQNNLPKKLQDPGSFTLPCSIGHLRFGKCLVDLGASVSLMPLTVSKKLGLTNFKKTRISLILADRSVRYPIGVLEDVPIRVGECIIPTDFVVLEMDDEPTDPIILGRPFLATAGANIDVKKGVIDLHLGSSVLKFNNLEVMKKPTIENKVFYVATHEDVVKNELEVIEASNGKTSMESDWSKLNSPKPELNPLSPGVKFRTNHKAKKEEKGDGIGVSTGDRSILTWNDRSKISETLDRSKSVGSIDQNLRGYPGSTATTWIDRSKIPENADRLTSTMNDRSKSKRIYDGFRIDRSHWDRSIAAPGTKFLSILPYVFFFLVSSFILIFTPRRCEVSLGEGIR